MIQDSRGDLKRLTPEEKDLFRWERSPRLYVFFSFDLVNSTAYKVVKKEKWPVVFAHFYQVLKKEMKQGFPDVKVWKYIGDEILFFKELDTRASLFEIIPTASEVLANTLKHLDSLFQEDFKGLSLKGAIWCAPVTVMRGEELKNLQKEKAQNIENIALDLLYDEHTLRDFIGPDIDIGFRISNYVEKEKLVISCDFAYLLLIAEPPLDYKVKKDELVKNLKIVSYEDLKGIWTDRYYPIIWYHDNWKSITDTFEYDDRFKSPIIDNIYRKQTDNLEELKKIFDQLGIIEEKEKLLEILKESETAAKEKAKPTPSGLIPIKSRQ